MNTIKATYEIGAYDFYTNNQYDKYNKEIYLNQFGDERKAFKEWETDTNLKTSEMLKELNLQVGMKITVLYGGANKLRKYTGVIEFIKYGDKDKYRKLGIVSHNCTATIVLNQGKSTKIIESVWIKSISVY